MNIDLLECTMTYIERHPDEWCQGIWTSCFSGICCRIAGVQDSLDGDTAQALLGLSDHQASNLFAGSNTKAQLRYLVDYWTREARAAALIEEAEQLVLFASQQELVAS